MKQIKQIFSAQGPAYITRKNRESLNPFVLFDAGLVQTDEKNWGFDWHPHSGVATLTFPFIGDLNHADSGGNSGIIKEGGFQWMQAGGGIWHKEFYHPMNNQIGVHQLWVRLGPKEEEAPVQYFDVDPSEILTDGNTQILIGGYNNQVSPYKVPANITILNVKLNAGEEWTFQPPKNQERGFIYPRSGSVEIGTQTINKFFLGQFEESNKPAFIKAIEDTEFLVALAEPSPYPIVHQYGQIHTNKKSLEDSTIKIRDIGEQLKKQGVL